MKIKSIHIEKSRTIKVAGTLGREAYRKVVIGFHADLEPEDSYEAGYRDLSHMVDSAMLDEVQKFKKG